jgi:hypothetical protein
MAGTGILTAKEATVAREKIAQKYSLPPGSILR